MATLHAATTSSSVPPAAVCRAMVAVEKAKANPETLASELAGSGPAPRRWRLVLTSSTADVRSAAGGGRYFPVSAVQSWALGPNGGGVITNGVYLGHWAALQFSGPCRLSRGRLLHFDFERLQLRLLGWRGTLRLKPGDYAGLPAEGTRELQKSPFFLFAHADERCVVARGRSGGVALWARAGPEWLLTAGALLL